MRATGSKPNLEDMRELLRDVLTLLDSTRKRKILIEMEVEEVLSIADNFWFVSDFEDAGMKRFQMAVVDNKPEHQEVLKFGEAAASNRGIPTRAFTTIEEAEAWLLN